MNKQEIITFREALLGIADMSAKSWVYLPSNKDWTLSSICAILESDEVPPDLEDAPDAGVPEFAKQRRLIQALPVTVLQDVVRNARAQKPDATIEDLFRAFQYYHKHDAFIKLLRD